MKSSSEFYAMMKYDDHTIENAAIIIVFLNMWLFGIVLLRPSQSGLILFSVVIVSAGVLLLSTKILMILHNREIMRRKIRKT